MVGGVCIRFDSVFPFGSFQLGLYDEPLSSFFRNVNARNDELIDIPLGNCKGKIRTLKARVGILLYTWRVLDEDDMD